MLGLLFEISLDYGDLKCLKPPVSKHVTGYVPQLLSLVKITRGLRL